MRLRFSRSDSRRNFFSNVKRKMLTAALAVGMVAGIALPERTSSAQTPAASIPVKKAKAWLKANKSYFNLKPNDKTKEAKLVKFIAANMKSGLWYIPGTYRNSTKGWPIHPRCEPSTKNGDCWAMGFKNNWQAKPGMELDSKYCSSNTGKRDTERCKAGRPRLESPGYCYGIKDFKNFVEKCEMPFLKHLTKKP